VVTRWVRTDERTNERKNAADRQPENNAFADTVWSRRRKNRRVYRICFEERGMFANVRVVVKSRRTQLFAEAEYWDAASISLLGPGTHAVQSAAVPRRRSINATAIHCACFRLWTNTKGYFHRSWRALTGTTAFLLPVGHSIVMDKTEQEASTHKSADPRRQWFSDLWPWPMTFWPQNKWISWTIVQHFRVKFGDHSCIGFWDIVRKKQTHRQTTAVKTLPPPTSDCRGRGWVITSGGGCTVRETRDASEDLAAVTTSMQLHANISLTFSVYFPTPVRSVTLSS